MENEKGGDRTRTGDGDKLTVPVKVESATVDGNEWQRDNERRKR